jgi:hypothetical protein
MNGWLGQGQDQENGPLGVETPDGTAGWSSAVASQYISICQLRGER